MLSARLLWRDWRSGELRLLLVSLTLGVTIITGIGLFVERLHSGILSRSSNFLAGDRVLQTARPIAPAWLEQAAKLQLQYSYTLGFNTMLIHNEQLQLVAAKAVSQHYPLKGELRISDENFANSYLLSRGPASGEIWVDPRLLGQMQLKLGDRVGIGDARFSVTRLIHNEPDRSSNFSMGPRVMFSADDIDATGVVQPGSRVRYFYQFVGPAAQITQFEAWILPRLGPSEKWLDLRDSQPTIASAIRRAESFLLLGGSLGVLLASLAAAMSARRYSERHTDTVALLKSFGSAAGQIRQLFLMQLLLVFCVTTVLAWILGWLLQAGFFAIAQRWIAIEAAAFVIQPFILGAVTNIVCILAFAWPPLSRLHKIAPLRVLRRDVELPRFGVFSGVVLGALALLILMLIYTGNLLLTFSILAGIGIASLAIGVLALILLRSTRHIGLHAGEVLGLAMANLRRRADQNALQVLIFSVCILLVLMLAFVRTSLVEEWRSQLPPGTPNQFVLNIRSEQVDSVASWFLQQQISTEGLYPMVRGRLTDINGQAIKQLTSNEQRQQAGVEREVNFTWSAQLPADNKIVAGAWWGSDNVQAGEVSVEAKLAQRLGLKVGDTLSFQVATEHFTAKVTSLRELQWDRMKPNFYMVFSPGSLDGYPATWMTSFFLPQEQRGLLNDFFKTFPTVSLFDVDAIIKQVRDIVSQVSMAIEMLLGLIILAGVLVLVGSVQSSVQERVHDSAILRTLGAKRSLLMGSLLCEFALLGALSGLVAAFGAELSAYCLQHFVFHMAYTSHPYVWLLGPILGIILVCAAGYASTRYVVYTPPLQVLRSL